MASIWLYDDLWMVDRTSASPPLEHRSHEERYPALISADKEAETQTNLSLEPTGKDATRLCYLAVLLN